MFKLFLNIGFNFISLQKILQANAFLRASHLLYHVLKSKNCFLIPFYWTYDTLGLEQVVIEMSSKIIDSKSKEVHQMGKMMSTIEIKC